MKTVHHLTKTEIEDAIVTYMVKKLGIGDLTIPLKAEIIIELRQETTGDPRDPPYSVVSVIRAEVTREG